MSVHSAISSFIQQNPGDVSISILSCVVSCLSEPGVASNLVDQHRPICCKFMEHLINVINDGTKNPGVRLMAMECIYTLSAIPNDNFRRGDLFDAVQKLNESFEAFLESQAPNEAGDAGSLNEMLTIILFRCSGYNRLNAGDLLQQIFNGDDTRLVAALQSIIKNRSLEWDILHACIRCMYQLTTPASYFAAPEDNQPIETTKISAFQDKVSTLLIHFSQQNALHELFVEIGSRWEAAVQEFQLDSIIEGKTQLSKALLEGVTMNFVMVFRYLSVMLLNVADFCERMDLVHAYQNSFTERHQNFLVKTAIPFIRLAVRGWEATRDPAAPADSQENPYMNVAITALRLLRFVLYGASSPVPEEPLAAALASLTQQVHSMEELLRTEYVGMLVLVLTTEILCNVNAAAIPTLAPLFTKFVTTVVEDKSPLRPGAQFNTAQAFAYCIANETSTYCMNENESVIFLRDKLQDDDTVAVGQAAVAIRALEEQLTVLQSLMMELAIGQLLGDLCLLIPVGPGGEQARPRANWGAPPNLCDEADTEKRRKTGDKKKRKHPQEYVCMLTKKLMREPVLLSNGHRFELDVLQKVVDRVGHVDPLTGEAFTDEISVDAGLQQEIARYRVEMAARGDASAVA
ncbi:hypothetical protein, conserved [Trypanosoma brucei gambiense DAL972]|uniref:RING-type E3 ubiquitin transferase n=1 Tax=Trypanosoma brucei gambiense (strain MHOM/CI/86/DAL972) TaxID=679716 RepID=D0A6R1_TRYB9|nr:hypothetical protein, conserved [Trypanosoma brucei gambiense DAL972]CBH17362.1 hypothetical protein, conserved [Trypanosoma brucei gambiense DAL972]|eukprot:XP_011779626.1 hypothetical protein, conserved [Trypanosoma brucei gambiense DAL972]